MRDARVQESVKAHVNHDPKLGKLDRRSRRAWVRGMLTRGRLNGRPLGRAPGKTGQPKHFVEWQRIAAEVREVEAAKAGLS